MNNLVFFLASVSSLDPNLPSNKLQKRRKETKPKKKLGQCRLSVIPIDKGAWSLKGLVTEATKSSISSMMNSDANDKASELMITSATNHQFQNVSNYITYRLLDKSETYNKKMAAHVIKYAKRTEMLMKACKCFAKDQITILRFPAQFRNKCDSNGVFRRMA